MALKDWKKQKFDSAAKEEGFLGFYHNKVNGVILTIFNDSSRFRKRFTVSTSPMSGGVMINDFFTGGRHIGIDEEFDSKTKAMAYAMRYMRDY